MRTKSRSGSTLKARTRNPPVRLIEEQNAAILQKKKAEREEKLKLAKKKKLAVKKVIGAKSKPAASKAKKPQAKKESKKAAEKSTEKEPAKASAKKESATASKKAAGKEAKKPATKKTTDVPVKKSTKTTKKAAKAATAPISTAPVVSRPAARAIGKEVDLTGYKYGTPHSGMHQGSLDIVFCLDCTGSMASTIRACQDSIVDLALTLMNSERQDVRFCLIPYRDYTENYTSLVYPFTRDTDQMQENVNEQSASGGGDQPEAVTAALFDALCLDWRPEAAKLVVFMADAAAHGIYQHNDTYPNGDPHGKDPLVIAREMESLGISLYGVISGGDATALRFFPALSALTGGQCVSLGDANLLKDAVLSSARENMDIERRMGSVHTAMHSEARRLGRRLTNEETIGLASAAIADESHGGRPRIMVSNKLLRIEQKYLDAARSAKDINALKLKWAELDSVPAFTTTAAAPTVEEEIAERVSRMAQARFARSSDPVLVQFDEVEGKLTAHAVTEGYDGSKEVRFAEAVPDSSAGKRFLVDALLDAGAFYHARGKVAPAADDSE